MEVKNDKNESEQRLSDDRMTYLIEMISIKKDNHMTRIYSCISTPDLNSSLDQDKNNTEDVTQ